MKLYCIKKCYFNGRLFVPGEAVTLPKEIKFNPGTPKVVKEGKVVKAEVKGPHKYFTESAKEASKVVAEFDKSGGQTKKDAQEETRKVLNSVGLAREPKIDMQVERGAVSSAKKDEKDDLLG